MIVTPIESKITNLMHRINAEAEQGNITKEVAISNIRMLEGLAYDCFEKEIEADGDVTYCCAFLTKSLSKNE